MTTPFSPELLVAGTTYSVGATELTPEFCGVNDAQSFYIVSCAMLCRLLFVYSFFFMLLFGHSIFCFSYHIWL